ncbi:virion structural protein [Pseudomonas phage PhiPA3]|uniref:Virion structural protein n=1 Tax=Pseudomonas phage PhiPA3 TaxID=998086 RepID=F8SJX9_BPPA3|nr:virion structural protein [Pseudomonas phage PhiPA3]AEH03526.1 virion structural protein [Pseudomonas phage PhiPA3]
MLKSLHKYLASVEEFDETEGTPAEPPMAEEVDATAVTTSAEPEVDVQEAGDDVGQATPTEEIAPDGDLEVVEEKPVVPEPMATTNESTAVAEATAIGEQKQADVQSLVDQAEQLQATSADIVSEAAAEVEEGATDINGNGITEDQAESNSNAEALTAEAEAEAVQAEETPVEVEGADDAESGNTEAEASGDDDAPTTDENTDSGSDDLSGDTDVDLGGSGDNVAATDDTGITETGPETEVGELGAGEGESDDTDVVEEAETELESNDESDLSEEIPATDSEPVVEEVVEENAPTETEALVNNEGETEEEVNIPPEAEEIPAEELPEGGDVVETPEEIEEAAETAEDVSDDVEEVEAAKAEAETNAPTEIVDEIAEAAETVEEETGVDPLDTQASFDAVDEAAAAENKDEPVVEEVEEPAIDVEAGEIEETDEEADLDEGELDIPDVDTDTTEEDVAEAEAEADDIELEADEDEAKAIDASRTIADLQKEQTTVEEFIELLKFGLESEQFSIQTVILAQDKLDKLHDAFGKYSPGIPSMEDYGKDDLDKYYMTSLESFRGFISKINNLQRSLHEKVERWWHGGIVTKIDARSKAINKDIDLVLTKLSGASIQGKVSLSGLNSDLATRDGDLVKAVAGDLRVISEIAIKGLKDSERLQANIIDILNKTVTEGGGDKTTNLLQRALAIKPAQFLPIAFTAGSMLGGWVLESRGVIEGDSTGKKLRSLGDVGVPAVKRTKVADKVTKVELSKAELARLLTLAKAYAALAQKLAASAGMKAVDSFTENRIVRNRALDTGAHGGDVVTRASTWSDIGDIDELAGALLKVCASHIEVYKFITQHSLDVASGIVKLARKAL